MTPMTPDYSSLVQDDVKGLASPEEERALQSDPQKWKDALLVLLREVDGQLTSKRANSASGEISRVDYQTWRRGATFYRQKVLNRLADAKAAIRTKYEAEGGSAKGDTMGAILSELKGIHQTLRDNL